MKEITFADIHTLGHIIHEDERLKQYHYPEMLNRYDSNFVEFKQMPGLQAFKEQEEALRAFHQQFGQKHLKFRFPPDEKPDEGLTAYLKAENYSVGFLELFHIEPSAFASKENAFVEVQQVGDRQFEDFLKMQYATDLKYGEGFAKGKQSLLRRQFEEQDKQFLIAYFEGIPAGCAELIEGDSTVEIDNLFVLDEFQRKGIGSQIQQTVMGRAGKKTVILVADGEDTPRDMYLKQGYSYKGFQYEVLKVENGK